MTNDVFKDLKHLQLTQPELAWLKSTCPYLTESYLDYLVNFRFNPVQQITSSFVPIRIDAEGVEYGELELSIAGKWTETILYEVSIHALRSSSPRRVACSHERRRSTRR
jgi:nicotinate phosphoribosyltransferase